MTPTPDPALPEREPFGIDPDLKDRLDVFASGVYLGAENAEKERDEWKARALAAEARCGELEGALQPIIEAWDNPATRTHADVYYAVEFARARIDQALGDQQEAGL